MSGDSGGPLDDTRGMSDSSSMCTSALLAACTDGSDLIVLRAPLRTGRIYEEELRRAAALLGLPSDQLKRLSPGMWLLRPATSSDAFFAARRRLMHWLPTLGGVRMVGHILATAADSAGLIAACPRSAVAGAPKWTLAYEAHYPAADANVLPFTRLHGTPSLLIGLHAALGPAGYVPDISADADDAADDTADAADAGDAAVAAVAALVVLDCKNGLLLMRELALPRQPPSGWKAPSAVRPPAAALSRSVVAADRGAEAAQHDENAARLPWWLGRWAARDFAFSGSLSSLLATAALNLAACAHRASASVVEEEATSSLLGRGPLHGLRVYDCCCGSGTVLAAALAAGAAHVAGSDIRPDFVEGARKNLLELGLVCAPACPAPAGPAAAASPSAAASPTTAASSATDSAVVLPVPASAVSLFEHDATSPLPPTAAAAPLDPRCIDLVVSNPPWGKNFGSKHFDALPIVRSMVRQFPTATFCVLVNKLTSAGLQELFSAPPAVTAEEKPEQVLQVQVLKVGGVEAVLISRRATQAIP